MSENLKQFLSAYLEWVDSGAPDCEPFDRCTGLCTNTMNSTPHVRGLVKELKDAFKTDGLDRHYPFGGEDLYDAEADDCVLHLNPARIAWVRSKVAQYEAA